MSCDNIQPYHLKKIADALEEAATDALLAENEAMWDIRFFEGCKAGIHNGRGGRKLRDSVFWSIARLRGETDTNPPSPPPNRMNRK